MFLYASRQIRFLLVILLIIPLQGMLLAAPILPTIYAGGDDSVRNYRLYRMRTAVDNTCQIYYMTLPVNPEYDTRDASITLYQASQSIIFGPGFTTPDGDSFIAEIVPILGVPQATNLTGTGDANINWMQSSSFDETGALIADSKQFFDAAGRSLQSQSKVFYRTPSGAVYNHVLASQTIRDAYGRDAASTLPAPIDYADFSYRPNFIQHNASGANYTHSNFDLYTNGATNTDKTNNPDALWDATSSNPVQGTLAWYYSTYNSWEPYTPITNYPYTRQTWYQDGTGSAKKSAGVGDPIKMGSGHEISSNIAPVANELDFYIQVRNKFFATTDVGALPGSLVTQALQTVSHDANGLETITIRDRSGNALMTARVGIGLTVNNTISVPATGTNYYFKLMAAGTVGITGGSFTLYDMSTELSLSFSTGSTLPTGYYKLVNTGTTALTLTFSNSYADISYNFYDQKGQLLATIAPEGTKKLYSSPGLATYSSKTLVPFISLFGYDVRGRLISSLDPDGGIHHYIYRNDGKIRFSQNAVQALTGNFSYTNYDPLGRTVESGQYQPDAGGIMFGSAAMTGILETSAQGGGLTTGTKTDVSTVVFDAPDIGHGLAGLGYVQDPFNLSGAISLTQRYSSIINNSPNSANMVSATWFNYDEEGKLTWKIQYIGGLGYKTTDYTYDVLGHLVKKIFQKIIAAETFVHYFDYDPVSKQLWHVYTNTADNPDLSTRKLQATYTYYLHGGLRRVELAGNLQGIDYTYTLQGALKAINNSNKTQDPGFDGTSNSFAADAFGEVLDYYTGDYLNGRNNIAAIKGVNASANTDSYAGNIKAMTWYSEKPASLGLGDAPTTYVYQYDGKYQFTESTWGNNLNFGTTPASFTATGINKEKIGNTAGTIAPYDGNGNIQYLQRTDANGNLSDQFSYQYGNNNNQLTSVVNSSSSTTYATYSYDARGQVTGVNTGDANQKYMVYDVTGKVTAVYRDAAHTATQQIAAYVYDETGQRIKKIGYTSSGQINLVTYYVDGVIYTQPVNSGTYGAIVAQEYQISGADRLGIYYPPAAIYAYEMSDHLGNVRAVIAQSGATYQVRMYTDYYPYGMIINVGGTNDYRYGYQGRNSEKDPETGWNAFELRMYDSRIARWLQYDPAGQFCSPYIGMGNDPIKGIDKNGGEDGDYEDEEESFMPPSTFIDAKGKVVGGTIKDNDKGIYKVNGLTRDNFDESKIDEYKNEGELVGQSLFLTSFYYGEVDKFKGSIDLNSYAIRDWLEQKIYKNTPSASAYMSTYNSGSASEYDYKEYGRPPELKAGEIDDYHYRGSQIASGVYASARDAGNIGAGYVAGHDAWEWEAVQIAFRAKQYRQDNAGQYFLKFRSYMAAYLWGGGEEQPGTVNAEKYGWQLGYAVFLQQAFPGRSR